MVSSHGKSLADNRRTGNGGLVHGCFKTSAGKAGGCRTRVQFKTGPANIGLISIGNAGSGQYCEPYALDGVAGPDEDGSVLSVKDGDGVYCWLSAQWTCLPGILGTNNSWGLQCLT